MQHKFQWPKEMVLECFLCCYCREIFSVDEERSEKPVCPHCYSETKRGHTQVGSMTYVPFTVWGILRAVLARMKKR